MFCLEPHKSRELRAPLDDIVLGTPKMYFPVGL
ncbi:MAG: hypothetical protein ACD_21C00095G0001, partial [uncultured bacterium]